MQAMSCGGNLGGGPPGALRPWQRSSPWTRDGEVDVSASGIRHSWPGSSVLGQSAKGPDMSVSFARSIHLEVLVFGFVGGEVAYPEPAT